MTELRTTGFDYAALDAETRIVVQQKTGEIRAAMRRSVQEIIEIGAKLIEVKQRLGHGSFGAWLQAEFAWSQDTAERYMNVARVFGQIPHGAEFEAKALYLLAAPSTPESAREEAIERAQAGEIITHPVAQQIVANSKPINSRRASVGSASDIDSSLEAQVEPDEDETQERDAPPEDSIDGEPVRETHPYAYKHLYEGFGLATCRACSQIHPRWKAVKGGYWACAKCGTLTPDDAMALYDAEDAALEKRTAARNGRQKPKQNYAAPPVGGVDPRDLCQTPAYAVTPLLRYLPHSWRIWEPAAGEGLLVQALRDAGYHLHIITGDVLTGQDFFADAPPFWEWQGLVTNPPYSLKYRWLERCYELGKPFALLMPVEVLGAKAAQVLFRQHGIEVIFLSDRIDFKMPDAGWDGSGAQFPVAWFTHGLNVGQQMTFADIEAEKAAFKAQLRSAT